MSSKFNVVMSSVNRASGSIPNATYYFDWSSLPEGKFNLSFAFTSDIGNPTVIPIVDSAVLISVKDLGVMIPSYTAGNLSTCYTNGVLGVASSWYPANNNPNYLFANYLMNCPIQIANRPKNNNFSVQLYRLDGTTLSTLPVNYVLTLYFEPLKWGNVD